MDRRVVGVLGVSAVLLGLGLMFALFGGAPEAATATPEGAAKERKVTRFAPSPSGPERGEAASAPSGKAPPSPEQTEANPDGDPVDAGEPDGDAPEVPDIGIEVSAWPVSADGIKGAMGEVTPAIKGCYDTHLADVPDLAGRLAVGFTIEEVEGVGRITAVEARESTVDDGPLEACVLDVVRALQFDAPEHGQLHVNYPFLFSNE
ncbi:MAG: AgmX/PglI C-terminal domain-containing protein [Alphaproteobacteria bacterium]|nr:AgmX/PglI C-terminal domain-containing protein [Alphaproteobacteria bacterium]